MEKSNKSKYFAVVSENGWKDAKKIIERYQEKYGKDVTISEVLDKMDEGVVVLN